MRKIILSLFLISSFGIVTSLILLLTSAPLIFTFYLLICSLFSTCVSFTLKIIQKEKPNLASYLFVFGIFLILFFIYSVFNSELLKSFGVIILSVLTLLLFFGIDQFVKSTKTKLSLISRFVFSGAGVLLFFMQLTYNSSPLYYSLVSLLMIVGSVLLIISLVKPIFQKE